MRWSTIPRHDRVTPKKENGRSSSENRRSIHPRLPPLRTGAGAKKRKRSKGAGGKGGIGEPGNRRQGRQGEERPARGPDAMRLDSRVRGWGKETPAKPGAIPPSQRTSAQRKWGLGIGEMPSSCCRDCPAIRSPWHPGHKTPILIQESALPPSTALQSHKISGVSAI